MANNDDVLIVGSLKDEELRKSIDNLVDYVGDKTNEMAMKFNDGLDKMKLAMKDFAVTQKVSVDLMKQAWREMSTSFDAMVAAQSGATGGGSGSGGGKPAYPPNTIGAEEQYIKLLEKQRKEMELGSSELERQNRLLEARKTILQAEKSRNTFADEAKRAKEELRDAFKMPTNSLDQAQKKLVELERVARQYKNTNVFNKGQWYDLQNAIDKTREKIEKLNMATPTLKTIKGMDEKSVDDIAKKLRALRNVQVDPKNTAQVKKLGDEYQRLTRLQNELLGKGIQLTKSNNYLAQSFGYIRNRIVYALTLGAATSFVKQVYEIRSQYELLERSLGVLLGSFERGSQIFQELNTMALKSPFTLMELGTAAKQLTAYNFQANEVVNTTRRLADLSAALGVPMERLTYNLGQIRAQTVLTARDARDFANAGLPIVKSLADYYSELEGRVVTTGDVFDRMSKKAVSYNDVMAVLNQMTDEGGKFFDFQAKQAETLRVQLANLTLAWNNMLNEVGEANQGLLTAPIVAMKSLFQNWGEISHVITEIVIALGLYKGTQLVVNRLMGESAMVMKKSILVSKEKAAADLEREATTRKLLVSEQKQIANKGKIVAADYQAILSTRELTKTQALLLAAFNKQDKELMKALVKMKLLKKAEIENITVGKALGIVLKQVGISIASLGKTIAMFMPQMAAMAALGAIVEAVYTWSEISDKIKDINKSIVDSAKESADSIAKFLNDYQETYRKAFEYSSKVAKNGVPASMADGAPKYKNLNDEEAQKAWQAIKEQIELSSAASSTFISRLMAINDMNDRVRAGFDYLEKIHDVNGALETLDEKAIDIAGDWSKWWNLWTLPDGLIDNLKDYQNQLDKVAEKWGSLANARAASEQKIEGADGDLHEVVVQYDKFVSDLQKTTASMYNAFTSVGIDTAEGMREAFEKSNQKILADGNLSSKEQLQYNMAAEKQFIDYRKSLFEEEYAFEKGRGNMERAERIREEENAWVQAFGSGRAVSDAFFNWLKNQHASEITKMFGNMSKKELEQLDWSEEKWQKWARDNAESFSKQYGISFDNLKNLVNEANTWKIFLKLFITTDEKGVYDTLKDADAAANTAWSKIQRLKQRQAELNKIPASQLTDIQQEQSSNILGEITQAQNDLNDAIAKGGHVTKNKTKASKAQKTAEQEVADALRQELAVIRDIQSNYDKLRKSGVDNMDAINIATQGYADTLYRVNSILQKYGVNKFNAKEFAGKDVHKLLETLQKQRDDLVASGKIKTGSLKDLDVEIQKLTVDAKSYDMKKVTDGLNNELAKVKEEYELAVEFDANPELGGVFADMMGISKEQLAELPKDFKGVLSKLQSIIDSELGHGVFDLENNLNKKAFESWADAQGRELDSDRVKALKAMVDYANKIRMDETKKQVENWDKLLEKYAEYEYKRKQIMETAQRERDIAIKRNATKEVMDAIDNRERQELATLDFERFQKSPEWITATGDLAGMTTRALGSLIEKLEEYKRSATNLNPKQIKNLNNALKSLYSQQKKNNPFKEISIMMLEAQNRALNYNDAIDDTRKEIDKLEKEEKYAALSGQKTSQERLDRIEELKKRLEELIEKQKEAGELSTEEIVNAFNSVISIVKTATSVVTDFADALGGNTEGFKQFFSVLEKGGQGAAIGAQVGGGYGAVIGGVLGIATSLVETFADELSGNAGITKSIKESEAAVKRLEIAYIDLQRAIDKAYGSEVVGAKQAMAAAKEMEIKQLERQLELEESRKAKNRDGDKILELKKRIKELKYEIKDAAEEITNDLMGTDTYSFAEDLVRSMIDAFKKGEDYMKTFEESFDSMVDNLIMKSIVSRVVGAYLDRIWESVESGIQSRSKKEADEYGRLQARLSELESMDYYAYAQSYGTHNTPQSDSAIRWWENERQKEIEEIQKELEVAKKNYEAVSQLNDSDISNLIQQLAELKPELAERLKELIGNWYTFGSDKDKDKTLSALQQGIQGITENTAGAIEGYMNSVSQQVYLQSDLLTQIKDAIVGFDLDVQVGTMSKILLQLQYSYQIQVAIKDTLSGWSSNNGMSVRVEMVE